MAVRLVPQTLRTSYLIFTADDFGAGDEVNEAVEQGHRAGVLTAASLMMGAPATADAVDRARRLPDLSVGLHLVLADGCAVLPAKQVQGLADASGHMSAEMFVRGVRYFALPVVRRQLEAEIRAQFEAFAKTGLTLDHVNVHKHYHLHPTILTMMLKVGKEFGNPPVRLPREVAWSAALTGHISDRINAFLLSPWVNLMHHRILAAGVGHNDYIFGIAGSGAMDESRLLSILGRLPPGVSEIYLHPAAGGGTGRKELAALLSPRIHEAIAASGLTRGGYRSAIMARES